MNFLPIKDFCSTGSGGTPSRSRAAEFYSGGTIPWVKSGELSTGRVESASETITELAVKESSAKLLDPGAILVAMYGATVGQVAKLCIQAATNQAVCHIVPDESVCLRDYLYWVLRSAKSELLSKRVGGGQPNISQTILKDLQIPLPPLSEQKRIAGILDAADGLRAKRRAALAQLDTLLQSTFLDLFGDPGSNSKGWEKTKFGDLVVHGPQNGLYKPSELYGRGTRILRIDGFYDGRVRPLKTLKRVEISDAERETYGLQEDDVVVNRVNSREYLGKSAIVPALDEPVVFESNMMRSRLDKLRIDPVFAVQYLQSKYVKNQILTSSKDAVNQSSINQKDVNGFDFYLPPLDLQRRFASIVKSVERQKARHREHLAQLDTLFASLQQRAFKGEL